MTRRRLAALAAAPLVEPLPAQAPAASEDDLTVQRENLKRWRDQMGKASLPIATEPAFIFKA